MSNENVNEGGVEIESRLDMRLWCTEQGRNYIVQIKYDSIEIKHD